MVLLIFVGVLLVKENEGKCARNSQIKYFKKVENLKIIQIPIIYTHVDIAE